VNIVVAIIGFSDVASRTPVVVQVMTSRRRLSVLADRVSTTYGDQSSTPTPRNVVVVVRDTRRVGPELATEVVRTLDEAAQQQQQRQRRRRQVRAVTIRR